VILDLLRRRYSLRAFADRPVPDEVLAEMLEAGRLSPSGGNENPYRFGVVTDRDLIGRIAEAAYRQTWIAAAPLLIVLCVKVVPEEVAAGPFQECRFPQFREAIRAMPPSLFVALNQEEHQTKIPGSYMALVALEHGIGSTWVSRFRVPDVARLLELPRDVLPCEILVCGYPLGEGEMAPKKPLSEIVFRERWR
jgi:nitroreductase